MEKHLELRIKQFLQVDDDAGDGYGFGAGDGYGAGTGYGAGDGTGDGTGDGDGYGAGTGTGDGYGDGHGAGTGNGAGHGAGYGAGSGAGYGDGTGDGYGDDTGITELNGRHVYRIDGVSTIIDSVHGNYAKGSILNADFTLTSCWIARDDDFFAHGETLSGAVRDAAEKRLEESPLEERISKFRGEWPDADVKIAALLLWEWHHILTGSCKAGRNAFAKNHNIDIMNDSFTVREFITLTKDAYGSDAIRKLAAAYNIDLDK